VSQIHLTRNFAASATVVSPMSQPIWLLMLLTAPLQAACQVVSNTQHSLQDLFPGPILVEGGGGDIIHFGGPDPLVMDMLADMDKELRSQLVPRLHDAGSLAPQACGADVQKHCGAARSQLHCLGQHGSDVSEACRKEVGKSVPFVCSDAIDRFCDVLQSGLLACLSLHVHDLTEACKDTVYATQKVVTKTGAVFDPSSPMTSYLDEGQCGPRGDDAKADTSSCAHGVETLANVPLQDYAVMAVVQGCRYYAYQIYGCKQPKEHREAALDAHLSNKTGVPLAASVSRPPQAVSSLSAPRGDKKKAPRFSWFATFCMLFAMSLVIIALIGTLGQLGQRLLLVLGRGAQEKRPLRGGVKRAERDPETLYPVS